MSLRIIMFPDPMLRVRAKEVKHLRDDVLSKLPRLFELMYESGGIGLAATQVGIAQRFFIYDISDERSSPRVVINPRITWRSTERVTFEEGCLSIPNLRVPVQRSERIRVVWLDEKGAEHHRELEGLESILFQHEIDHLNGKLIIDRLPREQRAKLIEFLSRMRT